MTGLNATHLVYMWLPALSASLVKSDVFLFTQRKIMSSKNSTFSTQTSRQLDQVITALEAIRNLPQSPIRDRAIARYEQAKRILEKRIK